MSKKKPSRFRPLFDFLASLKLLAGLLILLVLATIVSTFIPQGRPVEEYLARYGMNGFRILHYFWLDEIFRSPWFQTLLVLLGVNILACTIKSLTEKKRHWSFIVIHSSLLILIAGGFVSSRARIQGELNLPKGELLDSYTWQGKKMPLGFQVRLKDFSVEYYPNTGERLLIALPGSDRPYEFSNLSQAWTPVPESGYEFQIEYFIPDFRLDQQTGQIFSASNEPRNPAILVHLRGEGADYREWVFARFADFHNRGKGPAQFQYLWGQATPKDFVADIEVLENGQVVVRKRVEVNHPLRFKGFSFYQTNYDPHDLSWTGLTVVRDPAVGIIFSGVGCLMVGLMCYIYLMPYLGKRSLSKRAV